MSIAISVRNLTSRAVREVIGDRGVRVIDNSLAFSEVKQGQTGIVRLVLAVVQGGGKFLGWLTLKALQGLWWLTRVSITSFFNWLVSQGTKLAVFDWNAADDELRRLQESNSTSLAATWGTAVGSGLGWLTGVGIGYGLGLAVPVIGGAGLARAIAGATTSEAIDEIQSVLRSALTQTVNVGVSNTVIEGYIQLRSLIKRVPRNRLNAYFGEENTDFILKEWGADGAPTLTFSGEIETQIDKIENDRIRAFVENAIEEYVDSFIEAGYIVANELDTAYQQFKMQNERQGQTASRAVTIIPDVNTPHERLYVEGTERDVKERAQQAIANYRILGQRDVGEIVGQPIDDYLKAKPHRRKATVIFKSVPGRAYTSPDGESAKIVTYTIPELELALNWPELKRATRPYNWGEFRATANLDNGRQMAVYGASAQEAEDKLRDLLSLSTANIVTLSISQEKDRDFRVRKRITRVYPYRLKLLVRRFDPDGSSYIDPEGNAYTDFNYVIPLWVDEEPPEFTQTSFV